jgi:hypothetical protein
VRKEACGEIEKVVSLTIPTSRSVFFPILCTQIVDYARNFIGFSGRSDVVIMEETKMMQSV